MFINYLKTAWRQLLKNRTYSFINIAGLSLGIVCTLLILFHVKEELNYDKGFSRANRLFRVTYDDKANNRHWAASAFPLAESLRQYFPQVKNIARLHRPYPYQVLSYTPAAGTVQRFEEKGGFFADPGAVELFDLQFTRGTPATALSETDAIVLTETMARKYFGHEDPLGKTIRDDGKKLLLKVTGVIKSFPFPTHLQFDYLLSMRTIEKYQDRRELENHGWCGFYSYILLDKASSEKLMESKIPAFLLQYYKPDGEPQNQILSAHNIHLQPITGIHLNSKLEKEMNANSDITYVYIFSMAALFILLIAAVNFINTSTALAFNRMKEIGLRKVVGASKPQLIRQFLGESFLTTLLATLFACGLFRLLMPFYNDLTLANFDIKGIFTWSNTGIILLFIITLSLLAGLYPAWFVSNFNAINSLKGKKDTRSPVNLFRKGLIVFQFVISVFMIFSTTIIYRQIRMFHEKDLGFDKEQVMAITLYPSMKANTAALIQEINGNPGVSAYSVVSTAPGDRFHMESITPVNGTNVKLPQIRRMWTDENFLSTMHVSLIKGRNFFRQTEGVKKHEYLLNEAAVKGFQLNDPVGRRFVLGADTGEVVGVIKDFNFASLHAAVEPLVIHYYPGNANYLLVKVQPGKIPQTLQFLASRIKQLTPAGMFTYTFIDEKLNRLYESENRMSRIFKAFTVIAIFISCLGLFALSVYSTQLRIKEIGIRKVLGASVPNVVALLSKGFLTLVLLATVISWPLAWYAMNRWLDGFAYRIYINIWSFILSGSFAMLAALLTLCYQTIKAALLNPVQHLKAE